MSCCCCGCHCHVVAKCDVATLRANRFCIVAVAKLLLVANKKKLCDEPRTDTKDTEEEDTAFLALHLGAVCHKNVVTF